MSYNLPFGQFPQQRLRRLRRAPWIRDLIREHSISTNDLIWPLFIRADDGPEKIVSMLDVVRYRIQDLKDVIQEAWDLGINAVMLFPLTPSHLKSDDAEEAFNENNLICQAIREIKKICPDIGVITDVALDPYTAHGHDGIFMNGDVDNDSTVVALCRQALNQAKAGADVISPSDMMDGRVQAIRQTLDENGFTHVLLMSYAVKYASAFYGPFRDAVESPFKGGLKLTYHMDVGNADMAVQEAAFDIQEGADMLIIKPGMPFLDIIFRISSMTPLPVFAYHVSGEYSMLKSTAENGWLNFENALIESMVAFKRAGCRGIITYAALEVARILKKMSSN